MSETVWTLESLKEHFDALLEAERRERDSSFESAKEKSASHNDLIKAMERQQATFITKDQVRWAFMALIAGAGVTTAIVVAFGGLAG